MSWLETVPLLLVVIPILTATVPIVLGLRFERTGWSVATVVCAGLTAAAAIVAYVVYTGDGPVIHQLGGFERPVGIELVADRFSASITLLVTSVSLVVLAFTRRGGPRGHTFYAAYLLLIGGLLGVTLTGDVFNLFVFLEITGLATYALVARSDGGEAAVAALKYLIIGTLGASLYLIGVGFLFLATGTLNMMDLGTTLAAAGYDDPLIRAAFAFVFVGFAIKVAQWPMHTWQPDAYQHAPDGVTPVIAALVSTVSAYALGRVLFTVFTVDFLHATPIAADVIVVVGSASVIAGSVLAVIQWDIKRMLAFSSVSQFGLIVAAYGVLTEWALLGAMVHLLGHGLIKAGMFLGIAILGFALGIRTIDEYAGLANQRPITAAAMAVLALALVGIPPSIGFLGKWYIAVGAVEGGRWLVATVIFLSTMLTLGYVAKLGERMYFHHAQPGDEPAAGVAADGGVSIRRRISIGMGAVLVGIAVLAVVLGFSGAMLQEAFGPFVEGVFADG